MIQLDFGFVSVKERPDVFIVILTAMNVRTQMGLAIAIPSKSVNRYGFIELKRFIFSIGRASSFIQIDDESSIKAWINAMCKEILGFQKGKTPTISNGNQSSIEKQFQSLFGVVKTMRFVLPI